MIKGNWTCSDGLICTDHISKKNEEARQHMRSRFWVEGSVSWYVSTKRALNCYARKREPFKVMKVAGTPMKEPEYVRIYLKDIPQEFIDKYKLEDHVRFVWVYFAVIRG